MFEFIGKYFWALAIAFTALSAFGIGVRKDSSTTNDAVSAAELQKARYRVCGAMILPWVVMGIGQVVGGVPNVWRFFRPQDLNPYVWSWYATSFVLSCGFAYWVLARGGAKYALALNLVRVSGWNGPVQVSENWVKVLVALGPPFTIVWIVLAWLMDVPEMKW